MWSDDVQRAEVHQNLIKCLFQGSFNRGELDWRSQADREVSIKNLPHKRCSQASILKLKVLAMLTQIYSIEEKIWFGTGYKIFASLLGAQNF